MTPLHHIGELVRNLMLAVPMPVVRGMFALLFIVLIIWVWRLPRERWAPEGGEKVSPGSNLKFWALIALAVQLAIYLVF